MRSSHNPRTRDKYPAAERGSLSPNDCSAKAVSYMSEWTFLLGERNTGDLDVGGDRYGSAASPLATTSTTFDEVDGALAREPMKSTPTSLRRDAEYAVLASRGGELKMRSGDTRLLRIERRLEAAEMEDMDRCRR